MKGGPKRRRRRLCATLLHRQSITAAAAAAAFALLLPAVLLFAPGPTNAFQSGDGAAAAVLAAVHGRRTRWGVVAAGGELARRDDFSSTSASSGSGRRAILGPPRASTGSSTESSLSKEAAAPEKSATKGITTKPKRRSLPDLQKPRLLSCRDELWEAKLSELQTYVDTYGSADVSRSYSASLAGWSARQRREYGLYRNGEKSSMTEERMEKLNALGFRWGPKPRTNKASTGEGDASRVNGGKQDGTFTESGQAQDGVAAEPSASLGREERWESRLDELKLFHSEFGHADVPEQPDDDKWRGLANWVKLQRVEYSRYVQQNNSSSSDLDSSTSSSDGSGSDGGTSGSAAATSTMTPERITKLDALNFTWDVYAQTWNNRFAELEHYRSAHGHCNVPLSYGSLGDWVQKVRLNYKRLQMGREPTVASLLTPERIQRLEDVGFDFDPHETQFRANMAELKRFKKEYGHIEVGTKRGKLSNWFYRQRTLYRKLLQGSETTGITPSRRAALEAVGFSPGMFERHDIPKDDGQRRPGGPLDHDGDSIPSPRAKWEDRYDELLDYVSVHGDANVPYVQGPLGRWVKEQRFNCRNDTRIKLLNEAGFVWDVRDYVWWSRFRELEEYKEVHGDANVPHSAGELGEWVAQQRRRYKRSVLRSCAAKSRGKATDGGTAILEEQCEVEQESGGISDDDDDEWDGDDRLDDARRCALDDIGFVWDRGGEISAGREEMWDAKFERLREYREKYGTCRVPVGHDASLCYWVNVQRRAFNKEKGGMPERRRKRLESIGFE